jgi:hypothetical protein
MGWRNVAYTCLDNASERLAEARAVLDVVKATPSTSEDFVRALLQVSEAITHAMGLAVDDGALLKSPDGGHPFAWAGAWSGQPYLSLRLCGVCGHSSVIHNKERPVKKDLHELNATARRLTCELIEFAATLDDPCMKLVVQQTARTVQQVVLTLETIDPAGPFAVHRKGETSSSSGPGSGAGEGNRP